MIEIKAATIKDIPTIQQLSNIVWPVTFAPILSQEQIMYMMDMMYSEASLRKQMEEDDHHYILALDSDHNYLAYLSYQHIIESSLTKIHKIYVLPNLQGKGVGKALIEYTSQKAQEVHNKYLTLNVNRFNPALDFYKHTGFEVSKIEDIDIGNGFLMEDYVMLKSL